jgi:predicted enzyme related to lactoylglutathione lyase
MAEAATVVINAPGWIDLGSPDPEASRNFYSQLFGWSAEVVPDPEAGGYGIFKLDGKEVGGVGPLQMPQQPPAWTSYVLVEDADATTQKVKEAGGAVFAEPFDVMEEGRMAIIADPSGAALGLWQPKNHHGWEVARVPGAVAWVELSSRNLEATKPFYKAVFGWDTKDSPMGQTGTYTEWLLDGNSIAGGMPMAEMVPAEVPSYWMTYFNVADTDAATRRAGELGAVTIVEPTDIPDVGRFSILRDPQGATFGLLGQ